MRLTHCCDLSVFFLSKMQIQLGATYFPENKVLEALVAFTSEETFYSS